MKNKLKILCSGHKGFIGSHLYERLIADGHDVEGIDLKDGNDIRKYNFTEKYDVIFHLAAQSSIPKCEEYPVRAHTHNVLGTLQILEHARKTNAKFIFSSSSSVEYPSIYGTQKYFGEVYGTLFFELYRLKFVALRYFNVFGERQEISGDGSLVLPTFFEQYKEKKPFTIVGSGEQRRDFVYVKDVVEANIKAMNFLDKEIIGMFNIGSGKNYSINEIADMIDKNHPRTYLMPRNEPYETLANIFYTRTYLNWNPTVDVKDWIQAQL